MLQVKRKAKLVYIDDTTVMIELRPEEVSLLHAMRNKFKFGKMEITLRDGIPVRIERAVEGIDLTRSSDTSIIK